MFKTSESGAIIVQNWKFSWYPFEVNIYKLNIGYTMQKKNLPKIKSYFIGNS